MDFFRVPASILFFFPDLLLTAYFVLSFIFPDLRKSPNWYYLTIIAAASYMVVKWFFSYAIKKLYYYNRISSLFEIISNFKKGRYTVRTELTRGNDPMSELFRNISVVGRHFEDILSAQKGEIEKFRELYNNIIFSVSSYFIVLNEKNEIIFANESFCKNFQYSPEEVVKHHISDIFFFTAGRIDDSIEKARRTGQSVVLKSVRFMSKNRVAIIADIKVSLVKIQGENQIVFLMDDITSKARKDHQINLISQISESIQKDDEIERVLFAILTAVTSGSGLGFNRAMLFLSDDISSSLIGKMAVGPDSFEEALQIWGSVQGKDLDILDEMKGLSTSGSKGKFFYESVAGKKIPINEDNVITEALKTQKCIHVVDASKDSRLSEDLRNFMQVNEFIVSPLVSGNRAIGVIIADNRFNQAPIWHDTIELLSIFSVQAALSIESCNSLSIVREQMDKIKLRQEAIVESEKLAAVGRIAAHIAHEIRNPLVTIGGYARRILHQSNNPLKNLDKIGTAAQVILTESERLEKTLSNVMDFTRPSTYIQEYNNLNDIIEDTASLLKNVFQERKVECILDLKNNIPLIKSDYNQLKQVILNLYQNAMDAIDGNGKITTSSWVDTTSNTVKISIKDSGSGFKIENIEHLFDPFFTTKVTGVGLGLAIVKKIINDHNGEIIGRNHPEGGAEFIIEIPIPGID